MNYGSNWFKWLLWLAVIAGLILLIIGLFQFSGDPNSNGSGLAVIGLIIIIIALLIMLILYWFPSMKTASNNQACIPECTTHHRR